MITEDRTATNRQLLDFEEVCNRFENHWRSESAVDSIESCLQQVPESHRGILIEELVAIECELLIADGQVPDRKVYERRFSQWQDEVGAAFDACFDATRQPIARKPTQPERLGDYRIVREIGRGGMGIVYEAVQESLGRRVAIKTLASCQLYNPEHHRRFEREACAVASLHHTNIVAIHGAGEVDGVCYYAMQLVEGKSLSDVIAERKLVPSSKPTLGDESPSSLPWRAIDAAHRRVAEIGLQIAQALSYAHSRGVLHRDIKPANLLLDSNDIVWVTDFGLAMFDDQDDITQTGDVIGSLRYLPPEALKGKWSERGDVYGLGLTLYELLVLRPAFDETDRLSLLNQIIRGDRPPSPRSLNPAIPRDLETIVMKSIECDPNDRYQSADDLADDLSRLLNGQAIRARVASASERLWKWSRRKPALAGLIALTIFVAIFGVPTLAMLWMNADAARKTAEAERTVAVEARRTANTERRKSDVARQDAEAVAYANSMQLAQSFIQQSVGFEAGPVLEKWRDKTPNISRVARPDWPDSTHPHEATPPYQKLHVSTAPTNDQTSRNHISQVRDGWEWSYLNQLLDESLMTLEGHSGAVFHVAVRPDDAQIATVGGWTPADRTTQEFGEVILWDVLTGRKQHVLRDAEAHISGACYTRDGKRLATISASDQENNLLGSIRIWDTESGELLRRIPISPFFNRNYRLFGSRKAMPPKVQFSPDGKWIIANAFGIQVHCVNTGDVMWKTTGLAAVVLPAGTHLLVARAKETALFELATGKLERSFGNLNLPSDLMLTTDGGCFSTMILNSHVRLWHLPELKQIRDIPAQDIRWGGISPNGKLVVYGDRSGNLHMCPLGARGTTTTHMGHTGEISHGVFSHDGSWLVTASSDGTARVWKTDVAPRSRVLETGVQYDGLGDIAFAGDGSRVVYAASSWKKRSGRTIGSLGVTDKSDQHQPIDITHSTHWPRTDFAFSHDGRLLAAPASDPNEKQAIGYSHSGKINIWSSDTFRSLQTIDVGSSEITSVAWNHDATTLAVAAYEDGHSTISVVEVAASLREPSADEPARYSHGVDEGRITSIDFHENRLAASTNSGIRVWHCSDDLASMQDAEAVLYIPHTSCAAFLDFSPSGDRLAAAYQDERCVRVHDTRTGKLLYEVAAPRSVGCVRFSPNGRRLAMVGYDSLIYFCDAARGHRLITLDGADRQVGTISFTPRIIFSPDGRQIATNDWQGRITIWEAEPAPVD